MPRFIAYGDFGMSTPYFICAKTIAVYKCIWLIQKIKYTLKF